MSNLPKEVRINRSLPANDMIEQLVRKFEEFVRIVRDDLIALEGGGGGGVTDHGALTGLTDDDHVHYVLADGTRAMEHLDFETVASLPGTVTPGRIVRLVTDDRLYYGK